MIEAALVSKLRKNRATHWVISSSAVARSIWWPVETVGDKGPEYKYINSTCRRGMTTAVRRLIAFIFGN